MTIESEVKTLCYGFFAPIFFLWVGLSIDMKYIITNPALILLLVIITSIAKLLGSYIIGKKYLGAKESILLGVGLSVRFSTSIILVKILFDSHFIKTDLFSAIIASSIIFTFIIPILFSWFLLKFKIK